MKICGVACVKARESNVNLSQLVVGAHGPQLHKTSDGFDGILPLEDGKMSHVVVTKSGNCANR